MPEYFTVSEAARELDVTPRTIHKRIASGAMKAERFGALVWQIPASEVERWRQLGRQRPGPKPKARS